MSWKQVTLDKAFWFQEGPGVRKWQFRNTGIKLLNVSNIVKNGGIDLSKTERCLEPDEANGKYKHFLVDDGDLVIASSGISLDDDGLLRTRGSFIRKEHLPLCMNTSTIRFKAIEGVSTLSFLRHWLQSTEFRRQITREVTGIAQKNFGPSHLSKIFINLPPLSEQTRIAAILDKADDIRRKREKAIELTDSFLKSVFLEMFGDPLQNPKGWNVIKLESAFNEERSGTCCGPFGSALKKHEYVDSGIPVWGIDNVSPNRFTETGSLFITPEKYAQLKRYNAIDEDILISRAGTVGRMCVCHPSSLESIIGTNLIRLSLNKQKMLPYYFTSLYTYFASRLPGLRSSGDPDAYSFLNTTKLAELNIPCPPIDIQRDFEQVLIKTRATQVKLVNASAFKETLIASLSSALLKQSASSREVALSEPQQEAHAL